MRALLYCPSLCVHTCAEAESQPGTDGSPLPSFPHWIWVGVFKGCLCLSPHLYTFSFPMLFSPSFSSPLCKAQGTGARWGLQILALDEELSLSRRSQALTLDRLPAASSEWDTNTSGLLPERHIWY